MGGRGLCADASAQDSAASCLLQLQCLGWGDVDACSEVFTVRKGQYSCGSRRVQCFAASRSSNTPLFRADGPVGRHEGSEREHVLPQPAAGACYPGGESSCQVKKKNGSVLQGIQVRERRLCEGREQ